VSARPVVADSSQELRRRALRPSDDPRVIGELRRGQRAARDRRGEIVGGRWV